MKNKLRPRIIEWAAAVPVNSVDRAQKLKLTIRAILPYQICELRISYVYES